MPWDDLEEIAFTDNVVDSGLANELESLRISHLNSPWMGEEMTERTLRAAILLKDECPDRSLADCLHQASIWERG
jgi:hypothetical protein